MLKKDKYAFRFRGANRTVEETLHRAARSSSGFDSIINPQFPQFKPREGENCIRLLPPTWEDDTWGNYWDIKIWVHYKVGPKEARYLCLDKMGKGQCPVCEASLNAADRTEAKEFTPSEKHLCWVIDRNEEKAGPLVWDMPLKVYREINGRSRDKKTGELILLDQIDKESYDGFNITFFKEKTGSEAINVDYKGVEIDREPTPLHDDEKVEDRWIGYIKNNPLPSVLQFYEADYIEKVLTGRTEYKQEEEEGGDTARVKAEVMARRRSKVEEREDEEIEEVRPSSVRRRHVVVEPEEEADEGPKASSRRSFARYANSNGSVDTEDADIPGVVDIETKDEDTGTEKVSAQARSRLNRLKERHM